MDSLKNLHKADMFNWPAAYAFANTTVSVEIPLSKEGDVRNIKKIMSNRRYRKVFAELSAMPKKQVAELVKTELLKGFEEYKKRLKDTLVELELATTPNLVNSKIEGKPGVDWQPILFGCSAVDKPDGSVSFTGLRLKLQALIKIAGDLKFSDVHSIIVDMAEEAVRQRELFYDGTKYWSVDGSTLLQYYSLYNRQILATALVETSADIEKAKKAKDDVKAKYIEETLTSHDAAYTKYDMRFPHKIDWSKGHINVRHLSPLNDEEFDNILAAIKTDGN